MDEEWRDFGEGTKVNHGHNAKSSCMRFWTKASHRESSPIGLFIVSKFPSGRLGDAEAVHHDPQKVAADPNYDLRHPPSRQRASCDLLRPRRRASHCQDNPNRHLLQERAR